MRRQRKRGRLTLMILLVTLAASVMFVANSPMFERTPPTIEIADTIDWNLRQPIILPLRDNGGIRHYKVTMHDGSASFVIVDQQLSAPQKELNLSITLPKAGWNRRAKNATMRIEVQDTSRWNLWQGNSASKEVKIKIDTKRPTLFVVANSYAITKGGSALVIFGAKDAHLQSVAIKTNFGKHFLATPFFKEGYYAALIAWPIKEPHFRAWVEARDKAGNIAKAHIPLFLRNYRYKRSKIKLTNRFLEGKIADLSIAFDETANLSDPLARFKTINEKVRQKNEALIHRYASKVPQQMISQWSVQPFYPLKNSKKVASFGDHRSYYYKEKRISESYHLGVDLASIKMANIRTSNPGKVVFAGYNGIYGNMPLIDHGMGFYTLYGHCSNLLVKEGDRVTRGDIIAKTGKTGLALGDHLHFGTLVQGIEVRPVEWMDRRWIKLNIINIFKTAKRMIARDKRSEL